MKKKSRYTDFEKCCDQKPEEKCEEPVSGALFPVLRWLKLYGIFYLLVKKTREKGKETVNDLEFF